MRMFARICVAVATIGAALVATPASAASIDTVDLPWSATGPGAAQFQDVSCAQPQHCVAVGDIAGDRSVPVAAASVRGQWSSTILPVPDGAVYGWLTDVSCPLPTWCGAIGVGYLDRYRSVPFAAVLADDVWTEVPIPAPADGHGGRLDGLACPARDNCVAVGGYGDTRGRSVAFVEHFDGIGWTQVDLAPEQTAPVYLDDVDCPSTSECTAIGGGGDLAIFAQTLSAGMWSRKRLPAPDGALSASAEAVSCTGVQDCTIVGAFTGADGARHPYAQRLVGRRSTIEVLPQPSGAPVTTFDAVSCNPLPNGDRQCVASQIEGLTVQVRTDGAWTAQVLPTAGDGYSQLNGLDCAVVDACIAVGYADTGGYTNPALVDTWKGGRWTSRLVPLEGPPNLRLRGVSCSAAMSCTALGVSLDSDDVPRLALETLDAGGWTAAAIPPFPGVYTDDVYGVSCPTADSCVGLVRAYLGSDDAVLAVTGKLADGFQYTRLPITYSQLYAVSEPECPAVGACFAVASVLDRRNQEVRNVALTLADGTWTATNLPVPTGGRYAFIDAVSCASVSSCVAVGRFENSHHDYVSYADVLTADGWTASEVASLPDASAPILTAVSCPTTDWCVAVGNDRGNDRPLVQAFRNGQWHGRYVPAPGNPAIARLVSVSCAAVGACTAVGMTSDASALPVERPLVDTLTGSRWLSRIADDAGSLGARLSSVSCVADRVCVAVGYSAGRDGGLHPLAVTQG